MNYDYFIETVQMLCNHRRFLEAVNFCEEAIAKACWPRSAAGPSEALCRYMLADVCFRHTGDGLKARENYMKTVDLVGTDRAAIDALEKFPSFGKIIEEIYFASCVIMGLLADSYEEYFLYAERAKLIQPLPYKMRKNVEGVRLNKRNGIAWAQHIRTVSSPKKDAYLFNDACSASEWSMLLLLPQLNASADMINTAIDKYTYHISALIGDSTIHCVKIRHPVNGDNYLFIVENAMNAIRPFLDGAGTHDAARVAIDKLTKVRSMLEDRKRTFESKGYHAVAPAGVEDFIPPAQLRKEFEQRLQEGIEQRRTDKTESPPPPLHRAVGCLTVFLLATAACSYYGVTGEIKWLKWTAVVLAVLMALIDLLLILVICETRKKQKASER
jgi:hypothetical protein